MSQTRGDIMALSTRQMTEMFMEHYLKAAIKGPSGAPKNNPIILEEAAKKKKDLAEAKRTGNKKQT